jgi:hypothetical protein
MKALQRLRFLGLVVILTFALVVIGFNFVHGQVKTQDKPDKPPGKGKPQSYTWSAVILPGLENQSSIRGLGDLEYIPELDDEGWRFDDFDDNVKVFAEIRGPIQSQYSAVFIIEIFNPVRIEFGQIYNPFAEFNPYPPALENPELNEGFVYKACRYPGCEEGTTCRLNPYCIFDFIQNYPHPYEGYERMWFHIHSKWSYDLNEVDFEKWTVYDNLGFWLEFKAEGGVGIKCNESDLPVYNDFGFDAQDREYGYFEKIQEEDDTIDIWRVVAGKSSDGLLDYVADPNKNVNMGSNYVDCVFEKKKNRIVKVSDGFVPVVGTCDMRFEIIFIRTKQ